MVSRIASIDDLAQLLRLESVKKATLSNIPNTVPDHVVTEWLGKININKSRKFSGTYYADIGDHISFNNFGALYEVLGYDFKKLDDQLDMWCDPDNGCVHVNGYTCDPDTCGGEEG
jgi:hypothetical protein